MSLIQENAKNNPETNKCCVNVSHNSFFRIVSRGHFFVTSMSPVLNYSAWYEGCPETRVSDYQQSDEYTGCLATALPRCVLAPHASCFL